MQDILVYCQNELFNIVKTSSNQHDRCECIISCIFTITIINYGMFAICHWSSPRVSLRLLHFFYFCFFFFSPSSSSLFNVKNPMNWTTSIHILHIQYWPVNWSLLYGDRHEENADSSVRDANSMLVETIVIYHISGISTFSYPHTLIYSKPLNRFQIQWRVER